MFYIAHSWAWKNTIGMFEKLKHTLWPHYHRIVLVQHTCPFKYSFFLTTAKKCSMFRLRGQSNSTHQTSMDFLEILIRRLRVSCIEALIRQRDLHFFYQAFPVGAKSRSCCLMIVSMRETRTCNSVIVFWENPLAFGVHMYNHVHVEVMHVNLWPCLQWSNALKWRSALAIKTRKLWSSASGPKTLQSTSFILSTRYCWNYNEPQVNISISFDVAKCIPSEYKWVE